MAVLALYLAFLVGASLYVLTDWRRGWLLVIACAVVQDPVRKLTAGEPVYVSFAVLALYAAILFSARRSLIMHLREFGTRFPALQSAAAAFGFVLALAAFNGLATYGLAMWQVQAVSLVTYIVPLVAILFGYVWLDREARLHRFLLVYSVATSVALVGSFLEYLRFDSPILGLVGYEGEIIRHLPGIQIRMLSGIYRSPDVMAWHAATLASIGIAMVLRRGFNPRSSLWAAAAGWGFLICMLSGRRKAIYYVLVFTALFLWRYMGRLRIAQTVALVAILVSMAAIVRTLGSDDSTSVYARGAATNTSEIAHRLEGGLFTTIRQSGLMGAGLGSATQGVYHLLGNRTRNLGWQEGGLAKLAVEVGVPGLLTIAWIALIALQLMLRLTRIPDVEGSSLFVRVLLFALVGANAANFTASAQAYTDAILALMTGFFVGALFATAALDERLASADGPATSRTLAPAVPRVAT